MVTAPRVESPLDPPLAARVRLMQYIKPLSGALAWIVACLTVGLGVTALLEKLCPQTESPWWLARLGVIQAVGFAAATWLVGRVLDRRPWAAMGWKSGRAAPRHFLRGMLWGGALATLAVFLAVVLGGAHVYLHAPGPVFPVGGPVLVGVLFAALSEELVFRGYPLSRLADAVGPVGATIVSAVAFGAAHLMNPEAAALGALNVGLAGAWLALAFFSPGGMALAWGVHVGWNATLAELFNAPVSGYDLAIPGAHYSPGRWEWLDGGLFGPEGGVVGTIAIGIGVALFLRQARRRAVA
ncbi:MAG TPA: CPBP family intramembrane glutamic endopeptidase [Gemmatimonadales bacterium]|nr:CPBP family intramembrane glutamic endopeptidase [Gemmatimonadales bacterium]